ncbi:MAG: IS4 family transposase, partial [Prevotellaceae bacterium]|nr:IS4 family transposase [Prevotellaceae bacterium]
LDFDAQIAATTLSILQYNLFSTVKRFESYESFGALFRAVILNRYQYTLNKGIGKLREMYRC